MKEEIPKVYDVFETADLLGVSVKTVRRLIPDQLRASKIRGRILIQASAIRKLLADTEIQPRRRRREK